MLIMYEPYQPKIPLAKIENSTVPKPGDTHWFDEAGVPIAKVIAVYGDRAFITLKKKVQEQDPDGYTWTWVDTETQATAQVWKRWSSPERRFVVELRTPKIGERYLSQDLDGVKVVACANDRWGLYPVIIAQDDGTQR